MPQTAAMRGLIDAFEPLQALRESASYLRELRTTFRGNLGLAAAAYNAGPGQVEAWLAGRGVPAVRDPGLRPHRHGLRCGGLDLEAAAAAGGLDRADRRALRRARQADAREYASSSSAHVQPGVGAVGRPACRQLVRRRRPRQPTSGCAASTVPSWATGCRWSCTRAGVRARRSSSGFRKRAGRTRTRCARKLRAAGGACIVVRNPRG